MSVVSWHLGPQYWLAELFSFSGEVITSQIEKIFRRSKWQRKFSLFILLHKRANPILPSYLIPHLRARWASGSIESKTLQTLTSAYLSGVTWWSSSVSQSEAETIFSREVWQEGAKEAYEEAVESWWSLQLRAAATSSSPSAIIKVGDRQKFPKVLYYIFMLILWLISYLRITMLLPHIRVFGFFWVFWHL